MRGDDGTEILFNPLILSFGKSISLRVEHSGQILFDPKLLGDGFPKVRSETGISITDDLSGESKPSVYIVKV